MLYYFPKIRALAYVIGCGIPLACIAVWWFGFGGAVGVGFGGMAIALLAVMTPVVTFNLANKRAEARFDEIADMYNERCDPHVFITEAAPVVERMSEPYQPLELWFLSFYALALLDVGQTSDAAKIGRSMQARMNEAQSAEEQVSLISNVLPIVLRLFGPKAGLDTINRGLATIEENMTGALVESKNYLLAQRDMVVAVMNKDADYLLERCHAIRTNDTGAQQMRVRVLEAEKEAQVRCVIGDTEGARECWNFVLEHGNGLPCVKEAEKHVS